MTTRKVTRKVKKLKVQVLVYVYASQSQLSQIHRVSDCSRELSSSASNDPISTCNCMFVPAKWNSGCLCSFQLAAMICSLVEMDKAVQCALQVQVQPSA
mmetsp:Transcript_2452/g.2722  ORF Transcript_2452/g.2722 Transcript_2452/m.2722 type:complete len:99 (-) Transcript_2452:178-474(-)